MTTVNLQLSDHLKAFADQRAAEMGFATASAYVESLLAREAKRLDALTNLESQLIAGLNSGKPIDADDEYWQKKRADLISSHDKKDRG